MFQIFDNFLCLGNVVYMNLETNSPNGIGIKRKNADHGFILKNVPNLCLVKQKLKHRIFRGIGKNSYGFKVLHCVVSMFWNDMKLH